MEKFSSSSSLLPTNSQSLSVITDCQEFFLIYEDIIYKIIIAKSVYEIFIKCKNYLFTFNQEDLSILSNKKFYSTDEAYDFIINIFEQNKVLIKTIIIYKEIKLLMLLHLI